MTWRGRQDASRSAQHALWAACQLGADDEDVDAVCVEYLNYTALHIAAEAGQTSVVECLVALDADLRAVDSEGSTALEVARERRHTLAAEAIEAGGIEWLPKVLRKRDPRHPKKERMTFNQRVAVEVLGSASLEQKRW
ncbi:hypothetical protein T484DRAFT_1760994 [Baffinella frigidus]|nr:hypothetical protein T484DRAFT_1760994 [Cryptophyta sp. CCMP2293]